MADAAAAMLAPHRRDDVVRGLARGLVDEEDAVGHALAGYGVGPSAARLAAGRSATGVSAAAPRPSAAARPPHGRPAPRPGKAAAQAELRTGYFLTNPMVMLRVLAADTTVPAFGLEPADHELAGPWACVRAGLVKFDTLGHPAVLNRRFLAPAEGLTPRSFGTLQPLGRGPGP